MKSGYLILAAHPDDELIGCGITMQHNPQGTVIIVTDGKEGGDRQRPQLPPDLLVRERQEESRSVLTSLGIRDIHFLDQAQKIFRPLPVLDAVNRITGRGAGLQKIYSHYINDEHPDHVKVGTIALMLAMEWGVRLWQFSISLGYPESRAPDLVIDAAPEEVARKNRDLLQYRTQQHVTRDYLDKPECFWIGWTAEE